MPETAPVDVAAAAAAATHASDKIAVVCPGKACICPSMLSIWSRIPKFASVCLLMLQLSVAEIMRSYRRLYSTLANIKANSFQNSDKVRET